LGFRLCLRFVSSFYAFHRDTASNNASHWHIRRQLDGPPHVMLVIEVAHHRPQFFQVMLNCSTVASDTQMIHLAAAGHQRRSAARQALTVLLEERQVAEPLLVVGVDPSSKGRDVSDASLRVRWCPS
jgi:hypothetical protein